MSSTALVGPLPTVRFQDGTVQAYTPPRDTCDNRYAACADHHPACDCREAMFAEDHMEWRSMREEFQGAVNRLLIGHPTWAFRDGEKPCMCTGCQLARAAHVYPAGCFGEDE